MTEPYYPGNAAITLSLVTRLWAQGACREELLSWLSPGPGKLFQQSGIKDSAGLLLLPLEENLSPCLLPASLLVLGWQTIRQSCPFSLHLGNPSFLRSSNWLEHPLIQCDLILILITSTEALLPNKVKS